MKVFRFPLLITLASLAFFVLVAFLPGLNITFAKNIKVALVTGQNIDDLGWNQAGYEGLVKAGKIPGVEIAYSEQIPIPDVEPVLRDYAAKGYDLVINHNTVAKDAVMNTAKDYPNTKFLWTDGWELGPNVAVITPMAQEASYLAGLLAGYMTKSGIVGMVGGMDVPSTHRSYAGFKMGLKAGNPEAELLVNWVGTFYDVSAGHEAALSQIDSGADIIFGNGDGLNLGVISACSKKNVFAIGAVWDQYSFAPNVVLTSVLWGFGEAIPQVVKRVKAGTFKGEFYPTTLKNGLSTLAPYYENAKLIPHFVRAKIKEAREKILSGQLKIPEINK
jgi:basic membrane protein A